MKRGVAALAGLLSAIGLQVGMQAQAQETIQAVTEEFAPFNYTEDGKVTGYATRVVEEMFRRADVPHELHSYPWSRSYKLAQTLPNVVIFTMARTPERENEFQWIGALAKRRLYLYKLAARTDIKIDTIDDARRYRVSVNRDDAAEKLMLGLGFSYEKNLDLSPSDTQGLSKLLAGNVDFITGSDFTIGYLLQKNGIGTGKLRRSLQLVDQGEYFVAASKSTPPAIVRRLRSAYEQMEKDGTIKGMQPRLD
ncbi:MAG TPA: transporter substrate-binding domain-containing protein [Burkholderiaceae bacterium]